MNTSTLRPLTMYPTQYQVRSGEDRRARRNLTKGVPVCAMKCGPLPSNRRTRMMRWPEADSVEACAHGLPGRVMDMTRGERARAVGRDTAREASRVA